MFALIHINLYVNFKRFENPRDYCTRKTTLHTWKSNFLHDQHPFDQYFG